MSLSQPPLPPLTGVPLFLPPSPPPLPLIGLPTNPLPHLLSGLPLHPPLTSGLHAHTRVHPLSAAARVTSLSGFTTSSTSMWHSSTTRPHAPLCCSLMRCITYSGWSR